MNRLLLCSNYVFYIGSSFDTILHRHQAAQICIGLDNSFKLIDKNGMSKIFQAAIIAANTDHKLVAPNTAIATLFLDIQSNAYESISKQFNLRKNGAFLALNLSNELISKLNQLHNGCISWDFAERFGSQIIDSLTQTAPAPISTGLDPRVITVLKQIHSHTDSQVSIAALANSVHLSPSRLLHLFKSEVGAPIRCYSLWRRIHVAMQYAIEHQSLTKGAHHGGFTDSAHFSKTFKRMYGISPSAIVNNKIPVTIVYA